VGRRARTRAQAGTSGPSPKGAARRTPTPAPRRTRLDPVRRTIAAYIAAAFVVAVLTLAGIVVLGGTLGPFITLAVIVVAAGLVHRAATARLSGQALTDEDRVMQTMASGMLVLSVVLAAAGAVIATLA
jgi:hypothetical protein